MEWGVRNKPNIRNACSAFTDRGAPSLNTDIISRKSSNVQSPSLLELNTLQMRSPKGLTRSSGYCKIFDIDNLAFLLWPTFSGASCLNFLWALKMQWKQVRVKITVLLLLLIMAADNFVCGLSAACDVWNMCDDLIYVFHCQLHIIIIVFFCSW